jgi:hypothetical protein
MPLITITLGEGDDEKDIRFDVSMEDYNELLNNQVPGEKVGPGYNFLMSNVHQEDKATFRERILVDGKTPNGMLVMLIINEVTSEVTGDVAVKIKKPSKSPNK